MNESTEPESGVRAVRAGLGYTIGNILVKGIAFLTIPLFTRLMTTAQYGVYNTYSAYVSVLAVIVSLGLPSSVRNARYDLKGDESRYYSTSAILICAAFLIFMIMAISFRNALTQWTKLSWQLLLIAVVNSACTALHSYYNNILTIDYHSRQYLKLSIFYSVTSIICSVVLILAVFPDKSALGRAVGNMVPMILIGAFVLFQIWRRCKPTINQGFAKYGLTFGLPLIPSDLSSIILNQFDRIMIFRIVGEAEAGLYSFAYNVAVIYQVIIAAVESAWTPWMFEKIHRNETADLSKQIIIYVKILTIATIMLLLISPELIMVLSKSEYWDSRFAVIPIVVAMYFFAIATIPIGIEFYFKKTRWISVFTFGAALLNILLNLTFISRFGYIAAAYTTLVCYFLYALLHGIMAEHLTNMRLFFKRRILFPAVIMLASATIAVITVDIPVIRWAVFGSLLIGCIIYALLNKDQIQSFLQLLLPHNA